MKILLLLALLLPPLLLAQGQAESSSCSADPNSVVVGLKKIVENATQITSMKFAQPPGMDHPVLMILEQDGVISMWDPESNSTNTTIFLDIRDRVITLDETYDERGLLGAAYPVDFNKTGRFFIYYATECLVEGFNESNCPSANDISCNMSVFNHVENLEEWVVNDTTAEPQQLRVILRVKKPFMNHNGVNNVNINPYDPTKLFFALGDGGLANDPYENAQNLEKILGKLLVFDTTLWTPNTNCTVVTDNFNDLRKQCPDVFESIELFAYGIRNPSGVSFDRLPDANSTVRVIVADVGQDKFEEIDFIYQPRSNLGWDIREGFQCNNVDNCPKVTGMTAQRNATYTKAESIAPVTVIPHNNQRLGFPNALLGGFMLRDSGDLPCPLNDSYIFGSYTGEGVKTVGAGRLYFMQPNKTVDVTMIPGCNITLIDAANDEAELTNYTVDLPEIPPLYIPYNIYFDPVTLPDSAFFTSIGTNLEQNEIFVAVSNTGGPKKGQASVFQVVALVTDQQKIKEELVQLQKP